MSLVDQERFMEVKHRKRAQQEDPNAVPRNSEGFGRHYTRQETADEDATLLRGGLPATSLSDHGRLPVPAPVRQARSGPQLRVPPPLPEIPTRSLSFEGGVCPISLASASVGLPCSQQAAIAAAAVAAVAATHAEDDPHSWHRGLLAACKSADPGLCAAARQLEKQLADRLGSGLRAACGRLHLDAVAALLGAGADACSSDAMGRTALHALAAAPCPEAATLGAAREILDLLLCRGAQLWAADVFGATPLDMVAGRHMAQMLLAAAARTGASPASVAVQACSSAGRASNAGGAVRSHLSPTAGRAHLHPGRRLPSPIPEGIEPPQAFGHAHGMVPHTAMSISHGNRWVAEGMAGAAAMTL